MLYYNGKHCLPINFIGLCDVIAAAISQDIAMVLLILFFISCFYFQMTSKPLYNRMALQDECRCEILPLLRLHEDIWVHLVPYNIPEAYNNTHLVMLYCLTDLFYSVRGGC